MDSKLDDSLLAPDLHQTISCKVKFESQDKIVESIAKQISAHLANESSSTFRRKPIFVFACTRSDAHTVFTLLKNELKDVSKILLVADYKDYTKNQDTLDKMTVIVTSDDLN